MIRIRAWRLAAYLADWIAQQIKAGGFDASHAITVRPSNGHYEIISGHNRVEAASRTEHRKVPAWIREMDDEEAFMQLVLTNAQGELSPLERGDARPRGSGKGQAWKEHRGLCKSGRPRQARANRLC